MTENEFQLPILWQSKKFNSRHKGGDWKVRRGASHMSHVEGFPKTYDMPPFCSNWKNSIAIRQWGRVEWQPKKFGHHPTQPHHWMVTKTFRSPKKAWGEKFFSKMILHTPPPFLATEKFQSPSNIPPLSDGDRKGWDLCYHFGGKKFFPKFSFFGNQRIWSPSNDAGVLNGDQMFLVTIWR